MNTHPRVAQLQQYVMSELNAEQMAQIAAHLEACSRCSEQVSVECALDQLVLETAPVVSSRAADQALERLWVAVDAEPSVELATSLAPTELTRGVPGLRRQASVWCVVLGGLAAAAVVLIVWGPWQRPGSTPSSRANQRVTEREDQETPVTLLAEPLDLQRLAATRERVVQALLEAPIDREALVSAAQHPLRAAERVSEALAPLRAEGWPVDAHLRSLVLLAEPALAERALAHVVTVGGAPSLIAEALRAGVGGNVLLEMLPAGQLALAESPALVDALARRAAHNSRARELLAAELNVGTLRVLRKLANEQLEHVQQTLIASTPATVFGDRSALAELATLCEELPSEIVLPLLVEAGSPGSARNSTQLVELERWAHERFLDVAHESPELAAVALRPLFKNPASGDPRFEWAVEARLDAVVPMLAQQLNLRELAAVARARLARLATPSSAYALFVDVAEDVSGEADLGVLSKLLVDSPELAEGLGARAAATHAAALLQLADRLPSEVTDGLLLGALFALPVGHDPQGRRAQLLGALARVGTQQAGRSLLDRVEQLPADDTLLALAWATAARLAGDDAANRWRAGGGNPGTLAQVSAEVGERFDRAVTPPVRLLRPLERELPLVVLRD